MKFALGNKQWLFTVGKYGISPCLQLMGLFYLTCVILSSSFSAEFKLVEEYF
jgi:hypothetical protein